jgi:toxin YoeB
MTDIVFMPEAEADYLYWKNNSPNMIKRIKRLLEDISAHPYTGIGKPEKLKYELTGKWSRRINDEHRIVYSVNESESIVNVLALRYHYTKK